MTQRELAQRVDIDPQQISNWERGVYLPNDEDLAAVGTVLGQELTWFYIDHEGVAA